jgi:hypothetical protein
MPEVSVYRTERSGNQDLPYGLRDQILYYGAIHLTKRRAKIMIGSVRNSCAQAKGNNEHE